MLTAKATGLFCFLDWFCRQYLYVLFRPYCKEQNDLVLRDIRCKKAAVHVYKTIYFLISVVWGFQIMKDTHFLHKLYGGRAETFAAG